MTISESSRFDDLLAKWTRVLEGQGVHALLLLLNHRTPHRYTGIYRYDPPTLRSVYLVDAFDPELRKGADVAMSDAYCVIVGEQRKSIVFNDAQCDPRFAPRPNSPVVSYCGTLLSTSDGIPYGTLCHYDVARCDENVNDVAVLEALAPLIMAKITLESPQELPRVSAFA